MKFIDILQYPHDFNKVNLVTKTSRRGMYDEYKCSKCGIEGKRYGVSSNLTLLNSVSDKKIKECTGLPKQTEDKYVGKLIKVIECTAAGEAFRNLTPKSIHEVIIPPVEEVNGDRGIWVQGVREPVKLLFNEFDFIIFKRTKFKKSN